jgi:microcystin-dependent protein
MAISATPTDYSNLCSGRLAAKVNPTTATGLTVTADTFKTPAGTGSATWPTGNQIWKLSRKTRTNTEVEFIGVESLSQSGTAITTGTVIRYLPSNGSSLTSQGDGLTWPAGTVVELIWHAFTAEKTAFKDVANTFTAAQTFNALLTSTAGINMSGTSSYLRVPQLTTSQRTALSGANGMIVYDTDIGVHYQYIGGAWTTFATGSVVNAAHNTAGKLDVATTTEIASLTANDASSGAANALTVGVVGITSGATGKIPAMNTAGLLDVGIGGTGKASPATGTILIGAGTSAMTTIGPGTLSQVPVSNGTTIAMSILVPIGGIMIWSTDSAPTGWLLCYGQAVSRSTYSALFSVVSTTFGVGDGSTTFNLPDMRGRVPLGQDDMGGSSANRVTDSSADTIGLTGGTNDGAHSHTLTEDPDNGAGGAAINYVKNSPTGTTNVLPPYQTFNYIIYAAA